MLKECTKIPAVRLTTRSLIIRAALCFMGCVLLLSSTSPGCSLVGDISGDCQVNINDLVLMASQWLDSGPIAANLDGIGEVNFADFAILAGDWGQSEGTGSVTVTIAGTIPTGGQWRVDGGGPWYNSGDTASGISVGAHTITFADVAGYAKPADEPVNVPYGGSTTIETFVTMSSSVWKYLYDGSDQGTAWRTYAYNDSSWGSGPSQLGFSDNGGEGDENTLIGPKVNGRRTAYFRHKFNISNVFQLTELTIDLLYDDGAVVYINDQEAGRVHMPTGTVYFNTLANAQGENSTITLSGIPLSMLNEGDNILAVEVHQNTDNSSDISFDLDMEATRVIGGSGPAVVNAGAYIQQTGTLVVNISPQGAIDDGAQWRVDGGVWRDSGSEIVQAVGTHTVEFSSIPGWQRPGSVQVQVFNGMQAVVSRTYSPAQSTGLQITEFMADNDSRSPLGPGNILDGDLMSSDWIEIYNKSGSPIDISGKYLTDEADEKTKWQFPAGMSQLQPGAYLIVFASGKTQEENPGNYPYWDGTYYHTNFQLDKDGEYLALIDTDGTTVIHEYVKYPDQEENFSYGLFNSDTSFFAQATPGTANMGEFVAFVEKPDVNIKGGCYQTALDVTLSCGTIGALIYYTTDRTDPTPTNGTLYTGPIRIDSLTSLVAKGFRTGFQPSKARIETYIFLQSGVGTFNSNLPIIVVDTNGQPIIEDQVLKPYTDCHVVIIDTDKVTGRAAVTGPEHFSGIGQIRLRGESTYGINKGHYALEILDEYGEDEDVSLLGMPAESDWILSFDIVDTTLLKNEVAFKWFGDMGHYSPRQRYVEVYFNSDGGAISTSDFKGIYVLREKIKGSKNRVDIERMDALHNAEPQVTGGYIIKCDKYDDYVTFLEPYMEKANYNINWTGNGRPIVVEPGYEEITQPQINWIANYINEFHSVLWQNTSSIYYPGSQAKYTDYVDVPSWIDRGFVEEICYDSDAFSASQYAYKDRNGKIYCGPAWDFDHSFARPYNEWISNGSMFGRWYQKMEERLEHRITFADRWFQHRKTALNTDMTLAHIDQTVLLMTEAMSRSHAKPSSDFSTWTANVGLLKTWTVNRLNWLDGYIASTFAKKPPIFSPAGGYVNPGSSFGMSKPSGASGDIYYTTNGEDPRLSGGAVNPNATVYSGGSSVQTTETVVTMSSSVWKYLYDGSNQGTAWRAYGFNDSSWGSGPGQLGFGDFPTDETTNIGPKVNGRYTAYFRHKFNISNVSELTALTITLIHDDGAVVYINDEEVGRIYMPTGSISYITPANVEGENTNTVFSGISPSVLLEGDNILAVEVHQNVGTSPDLSFDLNLEATRVTVVPPPILLNKSTCVKARIKDGSSWSAMNTEVYAVDPVLANLRISELMYHPADPTPAEITAVADPNLNDEDFEFIELKNVGGTALNLNLVHFTDGIDFTFGDYTLAAGGYAVLVKNQPAFEARYGTGLPIAGQYLGSLDNNGEEIVLRDALGAEIHDFDYKDSWYELTDGSGFSLTMVNPASTDPNLWDEKVGWRSSLAAGGTPGGVDAVLAAGSIVINELLAHSHDPNSGPGLDWVELYNTTGQNIPIGGWFLSDRNNDDPNIMKYEIPSGTSIAAHGYLVFVENVTFGNSSAPGCHTPFGLSEAGETVYLYSGQSGQVTGYYQTEENFDASETDMTFGRYEKAELSGGYDFVRQSSPSQGFVNYGPLIPSVVITEINYHPSGVNADDYEFVELYNRSGSSVTLMSEASTETSPGVFVTENIPWRLEGTGYEFPAGVTIPSHSYILVAKTPATYTSAPYNLSNVYGPYDGKLDNGGEELEIQIPGDQEYGQKRYWIPIEKVDYDDVAPWPTTADGGGHSLQRINVNTYGRDYSNWQAATPTPGS